MLNQIVINLLISFLLLFSTNCYTQCIEDAGTYTVAIDGVNMGSSCGTFDLPSGSEITWTSNGDQVIAAGPNAGIVYSIFNVDPSGLDLTDPATYSTSNVEGGDPDNIAPYTTEETSCGGLSGTNSSWPSTVWVVPHTADFASIPPNVDTDIPGDGCVSAGCITQINYIPLENVVLGCGDVFTDPGGATGNYCDNETASWLICPDDPSATVSVDFTSFSTEGTFFSGCFDALTAHNGDNAFAPIIDEFCDANANPTTVVSTAASGCLFFTFTSDGTVNQAGWEAIVNCPIPCTVPSNDDCSGATLLTPQVSATCTSSTSGTLDCATPSGFTSDCSLSGNPTDVWYSFVATSASATIEVNGTADLAFEVLGGPCNDLVLYQTFSSFGIPINCVDDSSSGLETISVAGMVVGGTYFVRVFHFGTTAPTDMDANFDICIFGEEDVCGQNNTQGTITSCTNCTENDATATGSLGLDPNLAITATDCGPVTVVIEYSFDWEQGGNINWIHGVSFDAGPNWSAIEEGVPAGWVFMPNGITGQCNGNVFGPGFYFEGTGLAGTSSSFNPALGSCDCTPFSGAGFGELDSNDPSDNWGVNCTTGCPTFSLELTYCPPGVGSYTENFTITVSEDGNSGGWCTDGGCTTANDFSITINGACEENPSFDFEDFCEGSTNGPTNILTPGGTFSLISPPGGVSINGTTGVITGATAPQTLNVEYSLTGECGSPTSSTVMVDVLSMPDINNPGPQTVCNTYTLPTITGTDLTGSQDYYNDSQANGGTILTGPITTTTTVWIYDGVAGCEDEESFLVTIEPEITPTFAAVGPYCTGEAIPALPTTSTNGIMGTWSPAINNLATTTYTFMPSANECAVTTTLEIVIEPEVTPAFGAVGPYCTGEAIPALPTTSTNGIMGTWSPAINNTTTTTYTFMPTGGGCAVDVTLEIVIDLEVIPTFAAVGPYCTGEAIPALPTTSTNGIMGTWSPAINNTTTTTYTFMPTGGGCAVDATLEIVIDTEVTPTFAAVGPYCTGEAIPALPTTSTNGIMGTWSPAINNTTTTTYTFMPTGGGCAVDATLEIVIDTEVTPTFAAVGPYCSGEAIPALPTTSTNGVMGTWSPAINNLATTTYTFMPTGGGCAVDATLEIVIDTEVTPTFAAVGPYCSGEAIPALPTTSTNGVMGTWSPAINNLATTTYTFMPATNECATNITLQIVIDTPIIPAFDGVGSFCSGDVISALPTTSINGVVGVWSPAINNTTTTTYTFMPAASECATNTTLQIVIDAPITPTFNAVGSFCSGDVILGLPTTSTNGVVGTWSPAINNTATTTYTFTPANTECAISTTLEIVINEPVTPTFAAVGPYCTGDVIPALPTTSTNGIVGTWSPAINNTATTTYTFTPANTECAIATTLEIIVNPEETMVFNGLITTPYCINDVPQLLPTQDDNGEIGTWNISTISTTTAGTTTYTFTPDNVCGLPFDLIITVEDCQCASPATVNISPITSVCETETVSLTANIGGTATSVSWSSNGNGSFNDDISLTPIYTLGVNEIAAGSVEFTVETNDPDGAGLCTTAISNLTITIDSEITPTFDAVGSYCSGQVIPDLPAISTNSITGTWSPAINNTATTTYTFQPNAGECATNTTLEIVIDPATTPTFAAVGPFCSGENISTLPTTSTNGINGTWSPAINNTATTIYTFMPAANECATNTTLEIAIDEPITPIFTSVGPYCSGDVIPDLPNTSTNGITGTWSPAINNLATATYTFMPNNGQCAVNATMEIVITSPITPTFTAVGPYCTGDVIPDLPTTSNNGISGTWSPAINNTATTTYTFNPTSGECGTATTLVIVVNNEELPTFDQVGPYCSGDNIPPLPVISLNSITGTWSPVINNTATTTYTFTPADTECATATTLEITVNSEVTMVFNNLTTTPYCIDDIPQLLPTQDDNGETGSWNIPTISTNTAGTTTYTFTPDNICGLSFDLVITIEDCQCEFPATVNISPITSVCETETVSLIANIGGTATSVTWTSNGNGSFDDDTSLMPIYTLGANEIAAGTVEFTVETDDPDGPDLCTTAISAITLTIDSEIIPTFAAIDPYCSGDVIPALPTTSTNGITGAWSPAINNTTTTIYTFVPNAGQCATNQTMTIAVNSAVTMDFTGITTSYCIDDIPNALLITDNNGEAGSWSPNTINTSVVGTTTYTFTPTATCGEAFDIDITINNCGCVNPPTISINPILPICGGETIELTAILGGSASTVTWSSPSGNSFSELNNTTTIYTPNAADITAGSVVLTATTDDPDGTDVCSPASSNITLTINSEIEPTFNAVGPFCAGTTIGDLPLTSLENITGTWSPAINNMATTVYTFVPDAGQCASNQTMTIAVDPLVSMDFAGITTTYCIGDIPIALPAMDDNGEIGTWLPNTVSTVSAGTNTYTFTPTATCGQVFDIDITVGDCDCINEATISINPIMSICEGETIELTAILGGSASTVTWSSPSGNSFSELNNTTTIYTPNAADIATGNVILTATTDDPDGADLCSAASSNINLTINMNPTIDCSSPTTTSGPGANDGMITLDFAGGGMPYAQILLVGNTVGAIPVTVGASPMIIGNLAADTYDVTLIDANGCSDNCNFTISETGCIIAVMGSSSNVIDCTNTETTLTATSNIANTSYSWLSPSNVSLEGEMITVTEAGIYTLTGTNTNNNCESLPIEVEVIEDIAPPLAIIQNVDDELNCATIAAGITLTGTGSTALDVDYEWSLEGSIIGTEITQQIFGEGDYVFTVISTINGCSDFEAINIAENVAFPIASAGLDTELNCNDLTVILDGTGSSNFDNIIYSWSGPNGATIEDDMTTVPTINLAGEYIITVVDTSNLCSNMDTVIVADNAILPTAVVNGGFTIDCVILDGTLNGEGSSEGNNITYQWYDSNGELVNETDIRLDVNIGDIYTLEVTNTENGCSSSADVEVIESVTDFPEPVFNLESPTCFGDTDGNIILDSIIGGEAPYLYSFDGQSFSNNSFFTNLTAGNYSIIVQDALGCEEELNLNLVDGNDLSLNLGENQLISLGDSTEIEAIVNIPIPLIDTLIWELEESLSCLDCYEPTVTPFETTTYSAQVTDLNGCTAEDFVTIVVNRDLNIYVPTAFSPDNDGINDFLTVYAGEQVVEVTTFLIFDRWGEKVFEYFNFPANDITYGWDGFKDLQLMNSQVFVYHLEVELVDGTTEVIKGDFTLVK